MSTLRLKPWGRFQAVHDRALIHRWLDETGKKTHFYFRSKMEASRGGATYTHELRRIGGRLVAVGLRARGPHTASAPGSFPAKDTGKLIGSIRRETTADQMTIGTGMFYARYLKDGTKYMAKRKMSSDALAEVLPTVRGNLRGFAAWRR